MVRIGAYHLHSTRPKGPRSWQAIRSESKGPACPELVEGSERSESNGLFLVNSSYSKIFQTSFISCNQRFSKYKHTSCILFADFSQ